VAQLRVMAFTADGTQRVRTRIVRALVGLVVLLATTAASAQPGGAAGVSWLAHGSHQAAVRGDCASAYDLARRVKELDDAYYQAVVAQDAALAACVIVEPVMPPSTALVVKPLAYPAGSTPRRHGRVSAMRVVRQSFYGLLGSVVGSFAALSPILRQCDDGCDNSAVLVLLSGLGGGVGASIGVSIGGIGDDGDGSGAAALIGGLAGGFASYGLALSTSVGAGGTASFFLPTVGAMTGYYLTRNADDEEALPPIATPTALAAGERSTIVSLGRFEF
jgi:hypothetical protein